MKADLIHLNFLRCPGDLWPGAFDGPEHKSWSAQIRKFQKLCGFLHPKGNGVFLVSTREKPFFKSVTSGCGNASVALLRSLIKNPVEIFQMLLFLRAAQAGIPIALVNRSDDGRLLPGSDWFYRRCHACFVRELHPLPEIALRDLFTPSGGHPQTNRRARRILSWFDPDCPTRRDISKLRPISLGVRDGSVTDGPEKAEKKWDLFFAGDLHEKGFRGRLVGELQAVAVKRGWKILLRDRMPHGEYQKSLAASRLCLSPPGMGWDCWRHYEAMLAGSIPLMPYPTILQYQPLQDGEHCFYFAPEPGGLTRCLEKAMAAPEHLPAMAVAGREHVLKHHTYSKLREYIVRETLEAHARANP